MKTKTVGSVLRKYRKANGMSQLQLGEELRKAGFHAQRSALSAWEKDVALPGLHTFFIICKIYGITNIYDEFIGSYHPDDPLSCLNQEGRKKVLDYIDDLAASGRTATPSCARTCWHSTTAKSSRWPPSASRP